LRFARDWSSDVCSSDLGAGLAVVELGLATVWAVAKEELTFRALSMLTRAAFSFSDTATPAPRSLAEAATVLPMLIKKSFRAAIRSEERRAGEWWLRELH